MVKQQVPSDANAERPYRDCEPELTTTSTLSWTVFPETLPSSPLSANFLAVPFFLLSFLLSEMRSPVKPNNASSDPAICFSMPFAKVRDPGADSTSMKSAAISPLPTVKAGAARAASDRTSHHRTSRGIAPRVPFARNRTPCAIPCLARKNGRAALSTGFCRNLGRLRSCCRRKHFPGVRSGGGSPGQQPQG